MIKVCLLALLALSGAFAYRVSSAQQGSESKVSWSPSGNHVLQTQANAGRVVESTINFPQAFKTFPNVLLSIGTLDFQLGTPQGYQVEVVSVGLNLVNIKYTALTARQVYTVYVQWLAVDDDKVQIGYVFSDQLGAIATGSGERKISLKIGFNWQGVATPSSVVGAHFVTGTRFSAGNFQFVSNFRDVTPASGILDVSVNGNTNVDFLRVGYIVGPPSVLFVSPTVTFGQISETTSTFGVSEPFRTGTRYPIFGVNGYDMDQSRNGRFSVQDYSHANGAAEARVTVRTWSDTIFRSGTFRAVIYKPDTTPIWDPNCAELFSECNYQGNTIVLCDRVNSFPQQGWQGPVKSFHLPPGKSLKLYDQENLGGRVVTFSESQTCVQNLNFSFLQKAELH